jgi:hypothetical protein
MDGFYVAYMTGRVGTSLLMIVISQGTIVGADIGGINYDGTIAPKADGSGYNCSVVYVVQPGTALITGAPAPTEPQRIPVQFDLPNNFADGQIITIETPLGPLNAKFQKIRGL